MEPLIIPGKTDTPSVFFDSEANRFKLEGASLPENVFEFYNPLLTWLDTYCENPNPNTCLELRFDYLNTSSTKMVANVLKTLEKIVLRGSEVLVKWYYIKNDTEMRDLGEDFAASCILPFKMISEEG